MRRRIFLRGAAGVSLGLPILESLGGKAAAQDPIQGNLLIVRSANGFVQGADWWGTDEPDYFWPKNTGALTKAQLEADAGQRATGILAPFAHKLLMIRRVQSHYPGHSGSHHFGAASFTCSTVSGGDKDGRAHHESLDNKVERELSNTGNNPHVVCAGNTSGYVQETMSFGVGGATNPMEFNPAEAFRRVTGLIPNGRIGTGGGTTPQEPQGPDPLQVQRKSVNDLLKAQIDRLRGSSKLSNSDKQRLSDHFDHVRTVEIAVEEPPMMMMGGLPLCQPPGSIPGGGPTNDHNTMIRNADLHAQVIALAFACGSKRGAALQIGDGTNGTNYGKPYSFHAISHRATKGTGEDTGALSAAQAQNWHKDIDRMHVRMFLKALQHLDAVPAGSGTLLDQTVAVHTSEIQNGSHHHDELPFIFAGGKDLGLAQGKYVDTGGASLKKVWSTAGAAVGLKNGSGGPLDNFGNSTQAGGQLAAMKA